MTAPRRRWQFSMQAMFAAVIAACGLAWAIPAIHHARCMAIARDGKASLSNRMNAIWELSEHERAGLALQLIDSLPGALDLADLDAISILGEIGDDAAIAKLSELRETPYEGSGKCDARLESSLQRIQQRQNARRLGVATSRHAD